MTFEDNYTAKHILFVWEWYVQSMVVNACILLEFYNIQNYIK